MEALLKQFSLHGLTSDSLTQLKENRSNQRHSSMEQLMVMLQTEVKTYSCVFIVIDGLDEYSDVVQKDLMLKIQSLTSVKLLVTSRPIHSIEHDVCADCRLNITAKDSDIKSYLEGQLSSPHGRMMKRLISKSSSITEQDVIEMIIMKAKGMYVYVECCAFCFFIDGSYRFLLARLHMENLTQKSSLRSLREALEKLPNSFGATYDATLARINDQSPEHRNLAYHVLSWVSYAFRPLSLIELQYAVAIHEDMGEMDEEDLNDGEFLLSVCGGLVNIAERSTQVALVRK
jgi:hypothetical protein